MVSGISVTVGLTVAIVIWSFFRKYVLKGDIKTYLLLSKPMSELQREILRKNFQFYLLLPPKSQQIFEYRVRKFIILKEFIPRNFEEVTEEMKVLIAASAIQLTFGYPNVFLSYFKHIIIFPDQFYSQESRAFHKGEVNPRAKAIVLSWKHFAEGYATSEGVNLGLHEMAHALQLENIVMNDEYNFLNQDAINEWQLLADLEIQKIEKAEASIFRKYGGTNNAEFFAVAIEVFFEMPHDFKTYNEALYKALANLLRQDPIRLYTKL